MDHWPIYRLCLELHVFLIYVNMPCRAEFIQNTAYAVVAAIVVDSSHENKSILYDGYKSCRSRVPGTSRSQMLIVT